MTDAKQYRAPAIERAARILEYLAVAGREPTLSDFSRALGVGKSSVLGILRALEDVGWVERVGDGYRTGARLKGLFAAPDLAARARPFMEELAQKYGNSVCVGRVVGDRVAIEDCVEGRGLLHIALRPGSSLPLLAAATGKAHLSALEEGKARLLVEEASLPSFTSRSITDRDRFLAEVAIARVRGYATDEEEYLRGVNAVAAPFQVNSGRAILWMVALADALSPADFPRAGADLAACARSLAS